VIYSLNAHAADTIRYTVEMTFSFLCDKMDFFLVER